MAMLMTGACHVLMPKFEAKTAIEVIEKHDVTALITVLAMVADLISFLRDRGKEETVKKELNGRRSLSIDLIKEAGNFFPRAKILSPLHFHVGTYLSSVQTPRGICVDKPAPHAELKTDVRSSVSNSHLWFDTGDVGFMDEHGQAWLIGQESGQIKTGGENVEAIPFQHPGVAGIVIVGIPEARLTEMVVGSIRVKENWLWSDKSHELRDEKEERLLSDEIL
ncbi:hypothetical protein ACJRO7_016918 [Eucalyptus globulus]|uniref:Uncharacterized protein n=1 Tax=Eucalyptus globulus TaxID=34317 RepID=A0ABD3KNL2_EUCGL